MVISGTRKECFWGTTLDAGVTSSLNVFIARGSCVAQFETDEYLPHPKSIASDTTLLKSDTM